MPLLSLLSGLSLRRRSGVAPPQATGGAILRQDGGFMLRQDGGKVWRQIVGSQVASGANLMASTLFAPGIIGTNPANTVPGGLLSGLSNFSGGAASGQVINAPSAPHDPPGDWTLQLSDDFTRPATFGVEALDPNIWKQREYGGGSAHNGSSNWDYGNGLESTGSTVRVYNRRLASGAWKVDGFQAGTQNTNPAGFGYHKGFHQFHTRTRMRLSHPVMRGVGGYILMWPLPANEWSMEIDMVETPGATKNRADATVQWDDRGLYQLGGSNGNRQYQTSTINGRDLSQWHDYDCRKTYEIIDGITLATVEMWMDGTPFANATAWIRRRYLDRAMVPGVGSFVAPNLQWAQEWYTVPDSSTPASTYMEVDLMRVWAPPQ